MEGEVAYPGVHMYELPPEAVSVTWSPAQNVVGPFGDMLALGSERTVTGVIAETEEQPPG